jgi:hypothetical protein
MARIKKMPIDDILQEFRIRALTTPPEAIELTSLDREMSEILAKNNIPKEMKLKLYYDALNKFQNVRNMVMRVKPTTDTIQKSHQENEPKRMWDLEKNEDREEMYEKIKDRLQKTFISDDGENVYDENEFLGTKEEMKDALQFFLSLHPDFAAEKRPSSFLENLNQKFLPRVAEIIEDGLNDAGVEPVHWKQYFPRLGWNLFSKKQKKIATIMNAMNPKNPFATAPASVFEVTADEKKKTTSGGTPSKRFSSTTVTKDDAKKKKNKSFNSATADDEENADEDKGNTKVLSGRKFKGKRETSPVHLSSSRSDNVVARNLRSNKLKPHSTRNQTGRGIRRMKYLIDFNKWDSIIRSAK